jgi:hypothetical protein
MQKFQIGQTVLYTGPNFKGLPQTYLQPLCTTMMNPYSHIL